MRHATFAEKSGAISIIAPPEPYASEMKTRPRFASASTGDDALTDSASVGRCGVAFRIAPVAASIVSSPPVGGRLWPPAKTSTHSRPWIVAGTGDA